MYEIASGIQFIAKRTGVCVGDKTFFSEREISTSKCHRAISNAATSTATVYCRKAFFPSQHEAVKAGISFGAKILLVAGENLKSN